MPCTSRLPLIALALCMPAASATAAGPEPYRLSPGDTVEIGIASLSDRAQRAVIQPDGTIALPEVGSVTLVGLTATELQARMQALLPTRIFHLRRSDGQEQMVVVRPGDVTAVIADYRPVYVTGDVLTPGQQAYRPLMTVRQAIAVSGGFSLLRSRIGQTGTDPVDLRRDYEQAWGDYAKEYFHMLRLRAELADQDSFDETQPQGSPLSPVAGGAIARAEAQALKIALSDFRQEQGYLEKGRQDTAAQIEVLLKRQQVETEGVKADQEELARVTKVFQAGNMPNARLADVRRSLLLSSSAALQTSIELMRARRQLDDFARQHERSANARALALLGDLKETGARLNDIGARLRAAGQKIQTAGAAPGPLPLAGEPARAGIVIVRQNGETWQTLPADQDTVLMPGDTIEASYGTTSAATSMQKTEALPGQF